MSVELVRQAGELTLQWFRAEELRVEHKGDGTPVTEADKAAERYLRSEIARRWPADSIVGEEEAATTGASGRTWIIDPIDGTKAFTRGVPLYCNLLALEDEHGPAIGIINVPALAETVYAGRGLGCYINGVRVSVSNHARLEGAHVSTCGFDYWDDTLLLAIKHAGTNMRTWGDGYGYALVATGRIDAMIDPEVAVWDIAPMPVVLSEAGGRFTNFAGGDDLRHGTGLATNGLIHDELLDLISNSVSAGVLHSNPSTESARPRLIETS
ncbi:MAG: hypothetical protein N2037_12520 [Acidimicrobiales bacterium]|nr:hypothetical protein [Acidimicrobiales bacterium]